MSQHKIDIFLLRSLFKVLYRMDRKAFTGVSRDVRNILVINTTAIGDTLMSTPAIRAIRKAYPEARIVAMVSPAARAVLRTNPHLDGLIDHKGRVDLGYLLRLPGLLRRLKSEKFDMAIALHGNDPDTAPLTYVSGAAIRMGWKTSRLAFLFTHPVTTKIKDVHEIDIRLDNLKSIGIQSDGRHMELPVPEHAQDTVDELLKQRNIFGTDILGIHPFASCYGRAWSIEQAAVYGKLCLRNLVQSVVIIGGEKESRAAGQLAGMIGRRAFSFAGQLSIVESAGLLNRCKFLATGDTGPMHMAQALNIPTVVILRNCNPKETGAINESSLCISRDWMSSGDTPVNWVTGEFAYDQTRCFWSRLTNETLPQVVSRESYGSHVESA